MLPRHSETRHRTSLAGPRRGFSLMELFLVITILSVIALITFPLLRRPLNESVVQDAGQQLLRELAAARSSAIESGRPILFQYQAGSGRYYIGPQDQRLEINSNSSTVNQSPETKDRSQGNSGLSDRTAGATVSGPRPAAPAPEIRGELPGDVLFIHQTTSESDADVNPFSNRPAGTETGRERQQRINRINEENLPASERSSDRSPRKEGLTSAEDLAPESLEWSAPIRFYPSGRIKPAKVPLLSQEGFATDVEILGLAGRIRLSPLRRESTAE
jgi:prepilin-type N-terminal cleavage/methylation domain-containing protein